MIDDAWIGLGFVALTVALPCACGAFANAKPGVDLTALELACVDEATTREASRDCRNAVRRAWAKTNGADASDLEGGSSDALDHH